MVAPREQNNLPFRTIDDAEEILDNRIEDIELNEDPEDNSLIDSILGEGAQSRIVGQVNDWLVQRAVDNPGCVERFVCETYRTGETLSGVPYLMMQLTK